MHNIQHVIRDTNEINKVNHNIVTHLNKDSLDEYLNIKMNYNQSCYREQKNYNKSEFKLVDYKWNKLQSGNQKLIKFFHKENEVVEQFQKSKGIEQVEKINNIIERRDSCTNVADMFDEMFEDIKLPTVDPKVNDK